MTELRTCWLLDFSKAAAETDRFAGRPDQLELLAAGLLGEVGSVVAEMKKERREREAYPAYRGRMREEVGDFLWYFVRVVSLAQPTLLEELQRSAPATTAGAHYLRPFLQFGVAVGKALEPIADGRPADCACLRRVWDLLTAVCAEAGITLEEAARSNLEKTSSRWPTQKTYYPLFDEGYPEEEQLPRTLRIEFRELARTAQKAVLLRCNGLNFGDRLTDNIEDPDGYRYHDIFHFAHAVHLGWSPVVRSFLRCKRKSKPHIDEAQDGARARILEEAVSAIIFSRAKQLKFFDGLVHVDFDLLKTVKEIVRGYEVERAPLWQWEQAILDGYRLFRLLKERHGGHVTLDLEGRKLTYGE